MIEGRALAWWESDASNRALDNEIQVTNWEVFKDMIRNNSIQLGMMSVTIQTNILGFGAQCDAISL